MLIYGIVCFQAPAKIFFCEFDPSSAYYDVALVVIGKPVISQAVRRVII